MNRASGSADSARNTRSVVQLVMFDIDGTLVDSNAFDGELYAQAVQSVLGVAVDTTWASYRNVTDSGILEEILGRPAFDGDSTAARSAVKSRFFELTRAHLASSAGAVREVPGARALVESLLSTPKARVAIATGGWRESAFLKLRSIGLVPENLAIATATDALEKSQIMRIAEARALSGEPASRRSYFGDGLWDRRVSLELGYDFIAVGRAVQHEVAFENLEDRGAILAHLGL